MLLLMLLLIHVAETHEATFHKSNYSCKLVGNPGWQLGFPASLQLVRLVECGLNCETKYTQLAE